MWNTDKMHILLPCQCHLQNHGVTRPSQLNKIFWLFSQSMYTRKYSPEPRRRPSFQLKFFSTLVLGVTLFYTDNLIYRGLSGDLESRQYQQHRNMTAVFFHLVTLDVTWDSRTWLDEAWVELTKKFRSLYPLTMPIIIVDIVARFYECRPSIPPFENALTEVMATCRCLSFTIFIHERFGFRHAACPSKSEETYISTQKSRLI